jgi:Pilus formation protein N terminal region
MKIGLREMPANARPHIFSDQMMRTLVSAGLFALSIAPAFAGDLVVRYDQSQLLRLPRPASEIIVGNPSIADVALQDGNLLVVTGKTFGITNIIALDAEHNVIQDQRVMVERDDSRVVNLHKGSERFTYACTPNCEPTLTIGDDKDFFASVQSANSSKTGFSTGASDKGTAANNSQ